jgi:regulation of enolase protein 1 (concanavalin A-like superfamily)
MKKLFLLPVILLFTAATYGPPFSVSDFSSLTNRPNPSSVNPVGVVLGKTNAYDGNGGIFVFTPSSTNAVDDDIYLTTTTTGRWVRLTRDIATISSPLVLSNGTLSLAALTNYFTFLAGTNMQVTVTSNTVTYAMTNTTGGGSGNLITVNGGLVTNFWDNGYITFLNAGGGDYSLNIGDDTISTNKINSTFYNWVLSLSGGGGGTTNGLGVNGTFRTDWNAISSAEIAYTVSAGTNWYGSLVAGSVAANKLATTGTGTSTNFLAGDYSYKQVTTNMIPGLNAILATIGSGGSGGESNTASNLGTPSATNQGWYASKSGVDLQFRSLQIGPNLTLTSNANSIRLDVTLSTNSGTVVSVDGGSSLATVNFADSTGIAASLSTTNASFALVDRDFGDLTVSSSGTVMTIDNNVITSNKVAAANITQDKLGTSGTGLSTNFLAGDYSYKQVTTNMIPGLNAILATIGTGGGSGTGSVVTANGGSDMSRANITTNGFGLLVTQSGTNILLSTTNNYPVDYYAGGFLPLFAGLSNALTGDLHYKQSSDIRSPMWESGTGWNAMGMRASGGVWSVAEYNTNDFTVLESFITIDPTDLTGPTDIITFPNSGFNNKVVFEADVEFNGTTTFLGTTTFNDLAIGTITVVSNLTVPNNAYGAGWNGSTNVPNENSVYDEMELRAPKASPVFTGSATFTSLSASLINSRPYYNQENGDFWADGFNRSSAANAFLPNLSGSAVASGSVSGVLISTNNPVAWTMASSTTTNSGYFYWNGHASTFDISGGGDELTFILAISNTNKIQGAWGFIDDFTHTESVDGAYIRMDNGFIHGVIANNSSYTRTTTSNQLAIASTTFHRYIIRVSEDASYVTFFDLSPSGTGYTTNWTASVTNTLPSGSTRATSIGVVAINRDTPSAINLLSLDAVGKRNNRILPR